MMRRFTSTLERSARSFKHQRRLMSSEAKKLEGKVAVVTASTDGIGYAIAERLGMDGAKVTKLLISNLWSCVVDH